MYFKVKVISIIAAVMLMIVPVYADSTHGDNITNNYNATVEGGQGGQGGQGGDAYATGGKSYSDANASANAKSSSSSNSGAMAVDNSTHKLSSTVNNALSNSQSQSNTSVGTVTTTTTYTAPENKRELPNIITGSAPSLFSYRGKYVSTFDTLMPWELRVNWSAALVDSYPYCNVFCNGDMETAGVVGYEKYDSFNVVKSSKLQNMMIVTIERENPLVLWGTVARFALASGIKEVVPYDYKVTFSNKATGWNIGLGGGVSLIDGGSNDNTGGSVGAGIGFGSVETRPVEKCKAVFLMLW